MARFVLTIFAFFCTFSSKVIAADKDSFDFSLPIYQFTVPDANGREVSLSKYRGKVVIIVNVATYCGLTNTNYVQLKALYEKYHSRGLEIAAFPCNQFAGQEPDDAVAVKHVVKDTFGFEPDIYRKIEVNGANEHPLYAYLKSQQKGSFTDHIKWNFTKFLVDRNGYVVERYAPITEPLGMEKDIITLLEERTEL